MNATVRAPLDETVMKRPIRVERLSEKVIARFEKAKDGECAEVIETAYRFVDLITSNNNVICKGLNIHNLIETFNEFMSKNLFESEDYKVVEDGCGFDARLGRDSDSGAPELHIDIIKDNRVVETIACRRYEMRVIVNKLTRMLNQCAVF